MVGDILQPTHLIFILVVALLVLGPKRLPEVGRSLGKGIRDFRGAMAGLEDHTSDLRSPLEGNAAESVTPPVTPASVTISEEQGAREAVPSAALADQRHAETFAVDTQAVAVSPGPAVSGPADTAVLAEPTEPVVSRPREPTRGEPTEPAGEAVQDLGTVSEPPRVDGAAERADQAAPQDSR